MDSPIAPDIDPGTILHRFVDGSTVEELARAYQTSTQSIENIIRYAIKPKARIYP
ncbi:MAG TPA: hypothetical protein V6C46_07640 [Coleofasciculaceae cyanobacterium]